jgi:XapX domain-containing protein
MLRPYVVSFGVGVIVGAFYALLGVRSPAPPLIALLGLLGFLIGENGFPLVKGKLAPSAAAGVRKPEVSMRTQVRKACNWAEPGGERNGDRKKKEAA